MGLSIQPPTMEKASPGIILKGKYLRYYEDHPIVGINWVLQEEAELSEQERSEYIDIESELNWHGSDTVMFSTCDNNIWAYTEGNEDSDLPICLGREINMGRVIVTSKN